MDNGEWCYGHLYKNYFGDWVIVNEKSRLIVNDKTIGQYIDLMDKNGVRIFEGDIIKLTINRSLIFSVNWVDDCGMFCLKCLSRHPRLNFEAFDTDFTTVDGDECEIIGNVFDNPELLNQ